MGRRENSLRKVRQICWNRCQCRHRYAKLLLHLSPSIMSNGRSSSASAIGRIRNHSRGAVMVITMTEEDFLKRWSRRKREAEVAQPTAQETQISEAEATAS